jgi:CheY-like chemotaxis protein
MTSQFSSSPKPSGSFPAARGGTERGPTARGDIISTGDAASPGGVALDAGAISVAAPGNTSNPLGDFAGARPAHRILVIESDIEIADLMVALLENIGYSVEVAIDGQYGLLLADSFEPELILLGLSLPGMSGYDVTQVLRTEPRYAHRFRRTRIFYITDKDQMVQKRFHSLPGTPMHDYIFKPIDVPELLDKVARVFGDKLL